MENGGMRKLQCNLLSQFPKALALYYRDNLEEPLNWEDISQDQCFIPWSVFNPCSSHYRLPDKKIPPCSFWRICLHI